MVGQRCVESLNQYEKLILECESFSQINSWNGSCITYVYHKCVDYANDLIL